MVKGMTYSAIGIQNNLPRTVLLQPDYTPRVARRVNNYNRFTAVLHEFFFFKLGTVILNFHQWNIKKVINLNKIQLTGEILKHLFIGTAKLLKK